MKRALLTIMLIFSALILCAGPARVRTETGRMIRTASVDTIRVVDTVWVDVAAEAADHVGKDSAEVRFNRGIGTPDSIFIPKGTLGFGMTVSYNEYNLGTAPDDAGYQMLFSLLNGVAGSMTSFSISPHVSYFFKDNTSVGLRFDYEKSSLTVGNANLSLGDALSFEISDMNHLKQAYTGAVTLRHYMPIADSRRFAIFIEGRGAYTFAQSKTYEVDGTDKFGTYQEINKLALNLVPGIVCFMADNAAFEVSVGVLGFNTQKVVQTTNQVEVSEMKNSSANFRINLLSISFGMSFYIY